MAKKAAAKKAAGKVEPTMDTNPSGFDKLAAQGTQVHHEPASNDIDDRMAALLADHVAMGARPKA